MNAASQAPTFSISNLAQEFGITTRTIRFYEEKGLLSPSRSGSSRIYSPADRVKLKLILRGKRLGLTLEEITEALASLPENRTPTKRDWERLSTHWGRQLDERILRMQTLRESLSTCIGCGCLSMRSCALFNADDFVAKRGNGPRYLLEDMPEEGWPQE